MEAHAHRRNRRHHGGRSHAVPPGSRDRPLHGVLGIPDCLPPPPRRTGCLGAPRARRQLRCPSGLPRPARWGSVTARLVLDAAGAPSHPGAGRGDRLDSPADDRTAADRARRLRFRHAQGLDRLCRGDRDQPDYARGPSAPTVGGMVRMLLSGCSSSRRPGRGLLVFVFAWKLGTEALRPLAGEPIWEFIERGGSYGAPLALAWLLARRARNVGPTAGINRAKSVTGA